MKICANCGEVGSPKLHTKGNILIEIVLWCMLLVPGLIYSIWRHTTRGHVCRECGSDQLVPVESPRGIKLRAEFNPNADVRSTGRKVLDGLGLMR
jgi:hypothetical protein